MDITLLKSYLDDLGLTSINVVEDVLYEEKGGRFALSVRMADHRRFKASLVRWYPQISEQGDIDSDDLDAPDWESVVAEEITIEFFDGFDGRIFRVLARDDDGVPIVGRPQGRRWSWP